MTPLDQFQALLADLFQLDYADLDFGIYRLFKIKEEEVRAFIEEDLPRAVDAAFGTADAGEREQREAELEALAGEARDQIADDAILADGSFNVAEYGAVKAKAVQDIRERYESARAALQTDADATGQRADAFNHLLAFFGRYYEAGDFLPRRRYGRTETYAAPYDGQEVLFHWPTRGMHYIKSGEHFRDYAFTVDPATVGTLGEPVRVRFVLTDADLPRDNAKGDTRYFVPLPDQATFAPADGEALATLTVPFQYRPATTAEGKLKQDDLLDAAHDAILAAVPDAAAFAAEALRQAQGDGGPTLLAKRLRHFARRNSTDYFLHPELGPFLRRELDFYLKDQVLHLDDLDGDFDARRRLIRVVREVGERIIAFLDQIEGVQVRLFEKPKLVLRTDYLVPARLVPGDLWDEILANDAQQAAWADLFGAEDVNAAFVSAHPSLVVDTAHFDDAFRWRLLEGLHETLGSLDEATDGVLVHAENYQALTALRPRFEGQVQTVYIDPPYNTGGDGFIYKDRYQHASWLTMMEERLRAGRDLQPDSGFIAVSIDDAEYHRLTELMNVVYGAENAVANTVWDKNRKNDARLFSVGHEYMAVYAKSRPHHDAAGTRLREEKGGVSDARDWLESVKDQYEGDEKGLRDAWKSWVKEQPDAAVRKRLKRFTKIDPKEGPYRTDKDISWPGGGGPRYEVLHPETGRPVKLPSRGWVFAEPETFWQRYEEGVVLFGEDETTIPTVVNYLFDSDTQVMPSVFFSYAQTATQKLGHVFGTKGIFDNPKSWDDIARIANYLGGTTSTTLDYFAGSGTTAHSVIKLNRADGGRRTFLLVEQGEYVNTVLLPRVQKAMYAPDWKDGRPADGVFAPASEPSGDGATTLPPTVDGDAGAPYFARVPEWAERSPRLVKVLRLESYDDALHNLAATAHPPEDGATPATRRAEAVKTITGAEAYRLRYLFTLPLDAATTTLGTVLEDPSALTLETLTDAGVEARPVDLAETAVMLLGLRLDRVQTRTHQDRPYRLLHGRLPDATPAVLVLRDLRKPAILDPDAERAFLEDALADVPAGARVIANASCAYPGAESLDVRLAAALAPVG